MKKILLFLLTKDEVNRILLTKEDIKEALDYYVNNNNHDLIDFKYVGGVHRVGYCFDEDTPYYNGIVLTIKERKKDKTLCKLIYKY